MQCHRNEYSSREHKYYNSSMAQNPFDMAGGWFNGNHREQNMNMNSMMASNQHMSDYGCLPPTHSKFGMNKHKANRYGSSEIQAYNGPMGPNGPMDPYGAGHMGSTQFSQPALLGQNRYGQAMNSGYGGHYLSQHQQASSGMEYSNMGGRAFKMHGHNEGRSKYHKSSRYSSRVSSRSINSSRSIDHSDNENCSGSDYDDDDSGTDGEFNGGDSESDLEGHPRGHRPMY